MSITHRITWTWSSPGSTQNVSGVTSASGDGSDHRTITVPDSTDGQELDISWTNAHLQSLFILSTRALTLFSNVDGGAGNDTVQVHANVAIVYLAGAGQTNPFNTANVTKLYVDNSSGGDATLEIRVLVDSTP